MFLDTLAAAYAEAGQFPQAVATAEKALSLVKSPGDNPGPQDSVAFGPVSRRPPVSGDAAGTIAAGRLIETRGRWPCGQLRERRRHIRINYLIDPEMHRRFGNQPSGPIAPIGPNATPLAKDSPALFSVAPGASLVVSGAFSRGPRVGGSAVLGALR